MPTSLSILQTRIKALLMDTSGQVYDAGVLTESIRLALGEYQLAGDTPAQISELDGAETSTLNPLHESLIVWGAAAYAALARAVDRAESYQLGSESDQLRAWGDLRLKEFKAALGSLFPGYLAGSDGGAGSGGASSAVDPAKVAAEIALLNAQTMHVTGEESRAATSAAALAAEKQAEQARRADLRDSPAAASAAPWGGWPDPADERS